MSIIAVKNSSHFVVFLESKILVLKSKMVVIYNFLLVEGKKDENKFTVVVHRLS